MPDVSMSLTDGYSTAGTSGTGLGAVRRLADEFDLYGSARGTVITTRVRARRTKNPQATLLDIAGMSVSKEREPVCGDAWHITIPTARLLRRPTASAMVFRPWRRRVRPSSPSRRKAGFDLVAMLRMVHEGIRHTRAAIDDTLSVGAAELVGEAETVP
jgi:hypothetical protein